MPKRLLLDTNLVILLMIGLSDENQVPVHKRSRAYSIGDFRLLTRILETFDEIVATPAVLAEASNLLDLKAGSLDDKLFVNFSRYISTRDEIHVPSRNASARPEFRRLGLTDAGILEIGDLDLHILTSDLGLYLAASEAGYRVENFTHHIEAARI